MFQFILVHRIKNIPQEQKKKLHKDIMSIYHKFLYCGNHHNTIVIDLLVPMNTDIFIEVEMHSILKNAIALIKEYSVLF